MKITFVGHASFILEYDGKKILCDPWLTGKVFNESWALLSPPAPIDFEQIQYIWISHEHPDHLNFPSLKSIPEPTRKKITILHQKHASTRVIDSLRKLGFLNILELPLYQWKPLDPGLQIYCGSAGSQDSFVAFKTRTGTILNLNDCVFNSRQIKYLKRQMGEVSILLTQFSFANWVGNDSDEMHQAAKKIEDIRTQVNILQPTLTIPFASFVYFCNEENKRMNAWINTPQAIQQLGLPTIHFMYPGDVIDLRQLPVQKSHSENAVKKYMEDLRNMVIDPTPPPVELNLIVKAAEKSLQTLSEKYPRFLLKRMDPIEIYIHDLKKMMTIDPAENHVSVKAPSSPSALKARYTMCSQVAWYFFNFSWGSNTVDISGMYLDHQYAKKGRHKFFVLQNYLSTKIFDFSSFSQTLRTLDFFWQKKWEIFHRFII